MDHGNKGLKMYYKVAPFLIGVIIIVFFVYMYYGPRIKFNEYFSKNLNGIVKADVYTRSGDRIFKISGLTGYHQLYMKNTDSNSLNIGDSISKPRFSKEIKIYRKTSDKFNYLKSISILTDLKSNP